jgi:hypothetical protein
VFAKSKPSIHSSFLSASISFPSRRLQLQLIPSFFVLVSYFFQLVSSRSSVWSRLMWPGVELQRQTRMPLSGDKTNILLPKHFEGQSDELVFVFVSRLEDALIVIAEPTPCRLRLRELSFCSKNRNCKVALFLVLFASLLTLHRISQLSIHIHLCQELKPSHLLAVLLKSTSQLSGVDHSSQSTQLRLSYHLKRLPPKKTSPTSFPSRRVIKCRPFLSRSSKWTWSSRLVLPASSQRSQSPMVTLP